MHDRNSGSSLVLLTALGVVYGDIGTSPLYAFKEAFAGPHGLMPMQENVLAVLSALFWAMMLMISLKYVWVMLRFDNEGEGGVLALTALTSRLWRGDERWRRIIIAVGIFAASLFYGDALITPAISVLSAVEGLSVAAPSLTHLVEPIVIGVLVGLFVIQRRGTGSIGRYFGPITLLWFVSLALLGLHSVVQTPTVLAALDPRYALTFALHHPLAMFLLLSAIFLALTGGEALYADMGHLGARPIRMVWFALVCPALLINYFGQGALLLRTPEAMGNPFYLLAPEWFLWPLVILATAATVIASQATITGAYSLTLQAIRLGYLPRLFVRHTSDAQRGQIYIPAMNWMMLVGVLILVLEFGSSASLASAYGIAVSGTMIITTLLTIAVAMISPGRHRLLPLLLALILLLESLFLVSNLSKVASGGWMPLLLGLTIFLLLSTWKRGTSLVAEERRRLEIPLAEFVTKDWHEVPRVPGTAIYLSADPTVVPGALFHNIKHFKVMHRQIVFLHVATAGVPYVAESERLELRPLAPGMWALQARFGFRQESDLPQALRRLDEYGIDLVAEPATWFIARSNVVDGPGRMASWRCALFAWMTRQSEGAGSFFHLPPNRVVELGTRVVL